ncbi:hypothetical protein CEXT_239991 [Caerostris extrusa]|uniref:Uncharacterized protein n=1 Tax=Caerostris extrusa TaxID=172846 RepID=A0AAV4MIW9_CAEEX|nr:hypothetical protein CEXT_239991 [Caerostris extrusa]
MLCKHSGRKAHSLLLKLSNHSQAKPYYRLPLGTAGVFQHSIAAQCTMSWHSFHSKRRETAKRRISASITAILIPFSKFSSGISEGESAIRKLSRPYTYVYNGKKMSRAFCLTYLVNSSDEIFG